MPVPTPRRSAAARLFAACWLALPGALLAVNGCERDDERADRAVQETIAGVDRERGEAAAAGFDKAAKEAGASPAATAHAKVLLAQAQVEQAREILHEVDRNEAVVARLVFEIGNIAGQVQSSNVLIAGYQELAPKATGSISKLLTEGRGTLEGETTTRTEQATKLSGEIASLEAKIKDLGAARLAADKKANDLLRQSRRTTGRKSVELFTQSAAETKRSAGLAAQSGGLEHKLAQLKQDLALAQAQSKQIETAVTGFTSRIEQNEQSQKEIQDLIEKHRALSQSLVYGGDAPPPTAAPPATDDAAAPAETGDDAAAADTSAEPAAATEAGAEDTSAAPATTDDAGGDTGDTAVPREGADDEAAPAVESEGDAEPAAFQVEGEAPAEGAADEAPAAEPAEGEAPPAEPAAEGDAPAEPGAADAAPAGEDPAAEGDAAAAGAEGESAEAAAAARAAANLPPSTVVTNVTMADKGKELADLVTKVAARRGEAETLLNDALANYDAAIADAEKVLKAVGDDLRNPDLSGMPQKDGAWAWTAEVYSILKLNLQKANAQHMLAALHRDAAASHAWRQRMVTFARPVLAEARIAVPPGVEDAKLDEQLAAHVKASEEAYDATDKLLGDVIDGGGSGKSEEDAKREAQIARVIAQYGRSQLAGIKGDTDTAEKLFNGAKQTVTSGTLAELEYPLYIRAALGLITLPAAGEAPTTAPAPATQPDEAAPEEAAPEEAPAVDPATTAPAPEAAGPSNPPAGYGQPPGGSGAMPPGYGQPPPGPGQAPPQMPPGYGQPPSGAPGTGPPQMPTIPPGYGQPPAGAPGTGPPQMPTIPPGYGQPPPGAAQPPAMPTMPPVGGANPPPAGPGTEQPGGKSGKGKKSGKK